ncbi:polysaccharide deacetylase family protein [Clostridium amazonitimonense]|uniref:polysaccharide deacetylase family protein n=1 Tax=Clostridium amazonitimonense TaxID=1499689 RepID=UPI0005093B08|nr:polysaccharide deacetylase family protein [Clostridium amazonitimonense]
MKRKTNIILFLALILIVSMATTLFILKSRDKKNQQGKSEITYNEVNDKLREDESKDKEKKVKEEKNKDRFEGMELKDNSVGIPILYYHSVEESKDNELRISPEKFRKQLKYLKDNNYITLTLEEAYAYIKDNKSVPKNSVVITFDDGYKDNYDNAFPILKEFDYTATVFVISGLIDKDPNYLNSDEIKEMAKGGIEIGSHTVNHEKLVDISKEEQKQTLTKSKEDLEKLTGKPVTSIAYPFGVFDDNIIKLTEEAGYKLGFTINKGWGKGSENPLKLSRVYVSAFITDENFKERISKSNYN